MGDGYFTNECKDFTYQLLPDTDQGLQVQDAFWKFLGDSVPRMIVLGPIVWLFII